MRFRFVSGLLFSIIIAGTLQAQTIQVLQQGRNCSFRGLSVVSNRVAWVSGSKGTIVHTTDGGKTWHWQQVKGFEQADFRDIEAFSDKEAIIMSSGTPALILKTADAGLHWQVVYRNNNKAYFLDAMDFTPDGKTGYVLGDPINNKFLLLETKDGGHSWNSFGCLPDALPNEAAFAASGTCIRTDKHKNISIVTGGSIARYLHLSAANNVWEATQLPLAQGKPSQGAFSVSEDNKVVAGGDYANKLDRDSVSCRITADSNPMLSVQNGPAGFQSGVELISRGTYIATGTSGTNLSSNGGTNWKLIDANSFNVCRKAKHGSMVFFAGDGGKIGVFRK